MAQGLSSLVGLGRIMGGDKFDVKSFIGKQAKSGERDLLKLKENLDALSEDMQAQLKCHVYKNHGAFVDVAKEMNTLEGDLSEMNHLLTEQRGLISALEDALFSGANDDQLDTARSGGGKEQMEANGGNVNNEDEPATNSLSVLLDSVDGCSRIVDVPGRALIFWSDLIELDTDRLVAIANVRVFLMNDALLIATLRGPRDNISGKGVKFSLDALYELDNVAVLTMTDTEWMKNVIKILVFPHTRLFQCADVRTKRRWIEQLERAKTAFLRDEMTKRYQKIEPSSGGVDIDNALDELDAIVDREEEALTNPFYEPRKRSAVSSPPISAAERRQNAAVSILFQSLGETAEELDVLIAQRQFERAVDAAHKAYAAIDAQLADPSSTSANRSKLFEHRLRIDNRVKQLTELLINELRLPDLDGDAQFLRGGLKTTRRAVTQLIRVGKASLACDLFLRYRSAVITFNVQNIKLDGVVVSYVKKLNSVFFDCVVKTCAEFSECFNTAPACYSAFAVWIENSLVDFVNLLRASVINNKNETFANVASCVQMTKVHCRKLVPYGMNMEFLVDALLQNDIETLIVEQRKQLTDACMHRAAEDTWQPLTVKTDDALQRLVHELTEAGVPKLKDNVYSGNKLKLTNNTVQFSKSLLQFTDSLLRIEMRELYSLICESLSNVLDSQIKHFGRSMKSEQLMKDRAFVLNNLKYIVEEVVPKMREMLAAHVDNVQSCAEFAPLLKVCERARFMFQNAQGVKL